MSLSHSPRRFIRACIYIHWFVVGFERETTWRSEVAVIYMFLHHQGAAVEH